MNEKYYTWIIVIILCVTAIWALRALYALLFRSRLDELKPALKLLLKSGYKYGWVGFEHEKTGKFVQFRKYIEHNKIIGIQLAIPNTSNNKECVNFFTNKAMDKNLSVDTEEIEGRSQFIFLDFATDIDLAYNMVEEYFTNICKIHRKARYKHTFDGIDNDFRLVNRV